MAALPLLIAAAAMPAALAQEQDQGARGQGLERFHPGAKRAQWYDCGCYDTPVKHFPYSVVVFELGDHDVVVRPERHEAGFTFVALANRYGERYCSLESQQDCYGSFQDVCAFTDARFGSALEPFFPKCKVDEPEDR
jgi:hypothetical protein